MDSKLLSEFETIRKRLDALEVRLDSIENVGCKTIPIDPTFYPETEMEITEDGRPVDTAADTAFGADPADQA